MVKTLAGCAGDNVKGIYGVGEKRAIQYLKGHMKKGSKFYRLIEKNRMAMIKRNRPLVNLPYKGTPDFEVSRKEPFSSEQFTEEMRYIDVEEVLSGISREVIF
jgi:5'-3' exonuclease